MTLKFRLASFCSLVLLAVYVQTKLAADAPYDVKEHYSKSEVMIPMRDGVKLFTIIYAPRDHSQKYPLLITRTAYGIPPYGVENYRNTIGPNNDFAK
jgi:uncharacterized protein